MADNREPVAQADEWSRFHADRIKSNYPRWPNEAMLKVLFGGYSRRPVKPQPGWRVLDVGCGFGNNLVPFADLGCQCHGVEIHDEITVLARDALATRGYKAEFRTGNNRTVPYPDQSFDLVLSINAIHYEGDEALVLAALREFRRVLRPGGLLFLSTAGQEHDIYLRAKPLGKRLYRIQNYDFRDGQQFFFFDNEQDLKNYCARELEGVETGRVTERLFTMTVDHMIALCR